MVSDQLLAVITGRSPLSDRSDVDVEAAFLTKYQPEGAPPHRERGH
jgi:hypothetical protein